MNPNPQSAIRNPQSPAVLPFTHAGKTYTLFKHPRAVARHRAGQITTEQLRATAWYLRLTIQGKRKPFALAAANKQAISDAIDKLNGRAKQPEQFAAWLAEKQARRGVTIGTLAADWIAAGLPHSKTNPRDPAAAARLKANLERALPWWTNLPANSAADHFEDFAAARIGQTRFGDGRRTVDIQLAALSCLCQWAVLTQRLETNPFATRPRYVQDDQIEHCHRFMPDNDEQLHAILRHIFASKDPQDIIAGAWLAFGAFTGLRPHEPACLQRQPRASQFPAHLESEPPGLVFPMPDGSTRMKVYRGKGGQNPTITFHPVLTEFLDAWSAWLETNLPGGASVLASRPLFPGRQDRLGHVLSAATDQLKLRPMHPHGFMRAYYVRVQKSMGKDPATVAAELGQNTGGALIRTVYGNPNDPLGGNLYDWRPADGQPPAWEQLRDQTNPQLLTVNFR